MTKITPIFHERTLLEEVDRILAGSNFLLSAIIAQSPQPPKGIQNKTKFIVDRRLPEWSAEILGNEGQLLGMVFMMACGLVKIRAPFIEWRQSMKQYNVFKGDVWVGKVEAETMEEATAAAMKNPDFDGFSHVEERPETPSHDARA